ncbi:MAG: antimicrobial resistance protein Mig-14 [Azoarcus sp.]|jgi:CelD/BcsL family acetyltransferase involved in cellulose biosynthesis|nr:antimicrobial resistance protein Mig-14 [Azoarcus sp.]
MLSRFSFFRERGWAEIAAADYAEIWQRYGGSVATHPAFVGSLSGFAGIPVRYLAWREDGEAVAAIPVWGRYLAMSNAALKAMGKKGTFDPGNMEIVLPVLPDATGIPLRHAARYLSARHKAQFSGLRRQKEALAILKTADAFSAKFRYNQRRQLRLFTEAGGVIRPVAEFSPAELATIYIDLFEQRWEETATGAAAMAEVFSLLREWMTGSVLLLHGAPVAVQVLYRVESPQWISIEYINGGVAPEAQEFSPGSVLTYVNVEAAREDAAAREKSLRYSFGRTGRDYKKMWCVAEPVFEA